VKRIAAALALVVATPALAWEPSTTHAGLTEQAALSSRLHKRLVALGFTGGLFEPLTIPPADAPQLIAALKLLSPTHGAVPDARGRQVALGWLAAGAALADVPAKHGANHFFDPVTKRGWTEPDRSLIASLTDVVREAIGRADLPDKGIPAIDWVTHPKNPFNAESFYAQYAKAVSAATPGERSRHMAAALVAAGALLHVLADVGSPSRVRGDTAAHLQPLGAGPDDLGSRFERIAALAYGRLGMPAPSRVVTRTRLRDFFSTMDGQGLADLVARSYFSSNTLPASTRIGGKQLRPKLARPLPAVPERLNLMAASRDEGTVLRDKAGTCLARYRVERGVVEFWLDDECMLEQVTALLPEVSAFSTGLLEFLLRGELQIQLSDSIVVSGANLGPGTVEVLVEDGRGVRTKVATVETSISASAGQSPLARVAAPASGMRVVAVFKGVDKQGEQIVAVGAVPFGR
jgi:hypothetical protein